jgi:hypothetical protein
MKNTITLQQNLNLIKNKTVKPAIVYSDLTSEVKIIYKNNNGKSGISFN